MLTQLEGVAQVTLFSSIIKGKINHGNADYILSSYVGSVCLFPKHGVWRQEMEQPRQPWRKFLKIFFRPPIYLNLLKIINSSSDTLHSCMWTSNSEGLGARLVYILFIDLQSLINKIHLHGRLLLQRGRERCCCPHLSLSPPLPPTEQN